MALAVSINAGAPLAGTAVRPVHGVSMGPLYRASWINHIPRPQVGKDWTAGFARSGAPAVRTHGMGCIDMDQLWKPTTYAGYDASDGANYDWTIADECMANIYANAALPSLQATVRLGHSRALRASYPLFCEGPDDFEVFADVCLAIVSRYRGMGYGVTDFSVWNEPNGGVEDHTVSPFYCRAADVYARMYIAVYTKVKAAHGASVRIGAALGIDQFSLDVLSYLQGNGTSIDFLDHHSYPNTPSAVPYQVHARPGGMNLQDMLGSHGFSRLTPISIGEWSRSIGLDYAQDGPGAAFVGCGLIYLNGLTYANSGGLHNVERGYLYSAEKIWDGSKPDAPDRNAATVINWWSRMVGGTHLRTTGSKLPSSSGDDEVCVLASIDGTSSEILAMVAHYKPAAQRNAAPTTLPCGPLRLSLSGVPWAEWTWTQYANHGPSVLNAVAWGTGSGASATLNLSMHGNSYSTLRVARLQSGAAPEGAPAEGSGMRANKYPATPAVTAAQQATIERAQCAPLPPPAPPSRPAAAGLQAAAYAGIGAGAAGAALALWLGVRWVRRRGAQRPGGANALQIYEQDQKP